MKEKMKEIKFYDDELMVAMDSLRNYRLILDALKKAGFDTNLTEQGETALDSFIKKISEAIVKQANE